MILILFIKNLVNNLFRLNFAKNDNFVFSSLFLNLLLLFLSSSSSNKIFSEDLYSLWVFFFSPCFPYQLMLITSHYAVASFPSTVRTFLISNFLIILYYLFIYLYELSLIGISVLFNV